MAERDIKEKHEHTAALHPSANREVVCQYTTLDNFQGSKASVICSGWECPPAPAFSSSYVSAFYFAHSEALCTAYVFQFRAQ